MKEIQICGRLHSGWSPDVQMGYKAAGWRDDWQGYERGQSGHDGGMEIDSWRAATMAAASILRPWGLGREEGHHGRTMLRNSEEDAQEALASLTKPGSFRDEYAKIQLGSRVLAPYTKDLLVSWKNHPI